MWTNFQNIFFFLLWSEIFLPCILHHIDLKYLLSRRSQVLTLCRKWCIKYLGLVLEMDATTFPFTYVALTIFLGELFWLKLESFLFESFSFYCHCFSIGRVPMSIGLHKIRWTKKDPGKRPIREYTDLCSFQAWFNLWIIIRCNSTTYTLHYMFLCLKASSTHQRDWDCMIWNIVW